MTSVFVIELQCVHVEFGQNPQHLLTTKAERLAACLCFVSLQPTVQMNHSIIKATGIYIVARRLALQ